eukprot:365338-Chlamydomonas_euryale.AAC.13
MAICSRCGGGPRVSGGSAGVDAWECQEEKQTNVLLRAAGVEQQTGQARQTCCCALLGLRNRQGRPDKRAVARCWG